MPTVNESRANARDTSLIPAAPAPASAAVVQEQTARPAPTTLERSSPVEVAKPTPRRGQLKTRAIVIGLILLVVSGITYALRPKPMAVDSAVASLGPMRVTVDADAVTRVRQSF